MHLCPHCAVQQYYSAVNMPPPQTGKGLGKLNDHPSDLFILKSQSLQEPLVCHHTVGRLTTRRIKLGDWVPLSFRFIGSIINSLVMVNTSFTYASYSRWIISINKNYALLCFQIGENPSLLHKCRETNAATSSFTPGNPKVFIDGL